MLNRVILIGRLTRDPELRYTSSGVAVASFNLAVQRTYANSQGERETDFIDIVVWRQLAERCSNHLGKGRLVAVEGRLQIRSYDDSQGIRRKAAEVVADNVRYLDRAKDAPNPKDPGGVSAGFEKKNAGFGSEIDFSEDDIPF